MLNYLSASAPILVSYSHCLELSSKLNIKTRNWDSFFQFSRKNISSLWTCFFQIIFPTYQNNLVSFENFRGAWISISLTTLCFSKQVTDLPFRIPPAGNVTLTLLPRGSGFYISLSGIPVACDYSKTDCSLRVGHKTQPPADSLGKIPLETQPPGCEWLTVHEEAPWGEEQRPLASSMAEQPDDSQH